VVACPLIARLGGISLPGPRFEERSAEKAKDGAIVPDLKFLDHGVHLILDDIARHREKPGATYDALWKSAWARGYQDVLIPVHGSDTRYEGYLCLAYELPSGRTVISIDTGERMLAVVDAFEALPSPGAKVRITAIFAGEAEKWVVKTLAAIGCGLSLRFDQDASNKRVGDIGWPDKLRDALARARKAENGVTNQLNLQRMGVPPIEHEPPFKDQMMKLDDEMRKRISATPLTPDEEREKSKLRTQEQANAFFEKRKAKLAEQYRLESLQFREKTIPELRAEYDKRKEKADKLQAEADRISKLLAENLANVELGSQAAKMIERIEAASLPIVVGDMNPVLEDPQGRFKEIIETIVLLFEIASTQRRVAQ